jgi:hypothetical protein
MTLLLHFRASSQTLFRQQSMMQLAHIYGYGRDMVSPADMVGLKAERANLPWRTYLLAGVAKNNLGSVPHHRAPPVLAYRLSSFKSPASALMKIVAASAKTSCPATGVRISQGAPAFFAFQID